MPKKQRDKKSAEAAVTPKPRKRSAHEILAALGFAESSEAMLSSLKTLAPSVAVLRHVARKLMSLGRPTDAVESYCTTLGVDLHPKKGPRAPMLGEVRRYRAQALKNGIVYVRLPLGFLKLAKGDLLDVAYEAGQMTLVSAQRATDPGT
jgi:hypothetical protein